MKLQDSSFADKVIIHYSFDFGNVYFLQNIIITEFKEGIVSSFKKVKEIIDYAEKLYGPKTSIIYISNRINSYSVDPIDLIKTNNKYPNLKAVGVVYHAKMSQRFLNIEKMFCSKPIENFYSLGDAMNWATNLLEKNKAHKKYTNFKEIV